MTTSKAGIIAVTILQVATGVYHLRVIKNTINWQLKADFVDFDKDLEFAGITNRGKMLSVRNSKGPANIDGYPLQIDPPGEDWMCINCFSSGILLNTNKPTIMAVRRDMEAYSPTDLYIPKNEILERCICRDTSGFDSVNVVEGQMADIVAFHAENPTWTICITRYLIGLGVPHPVELSREDWSKFNRHIYTSQDHATFENTVPVEEQSCFWFPGTEIQKVEEVYGIEGTPKAFYNDRLGFHSFKILNPEKVAKAYPILQRFPRKQVKLEVCFNYCNDTIFSVADVLHNPRMLENEKIINVNSLIQTITINNICQKLPLLDYPLSTRKGLLCKEKLVEKYFIPLREATKRYKLENIESHVVYEPLEHYGHSAFPGRWILRSDVEKLEQRDHKAESRDRKERKKRLEALYGHLPAGFNKLDDAGVALYSSIQKRLIDGTLEDADASNMIPRDMELKTKLKECLQKQGMLFKCPLTGKEYITHFESIDDLIRVPGFMQVLEDLVFDTKWFRKVLSSQVLQSIALADSI